MGPRAGGAMACTAGLGSGPLCPWRASSRSRGGGSAGCRSRSPAVELPAAAALLSPRRAATASMQPVPGTEMSGSQRIALCNALMRDAEGRALLSNAPTAAADLDALACAVDAYDEDHLPLHAFLNPFALLAVSGAERYRRLGLLCCLLALINQTCLAVAFILSAPKTVAALSVSALGLCVGLAADCVIRALYGGEQQGDRAHPLFLVFDSAGIVLVLAQALEGLGWLAFSNATLAAGVRAIWPLTIANWVSRLALQSQLWNNHRQAIALKEGHALRSAANSSAMRMLDGAMDVATTGLDSAGLKSLTSSDLLSRVTAIWRNLQALAVAGSGNIWRRLVLGLSIADWVVLLMLWSCLDPSSHSASAAMYGWALVPMLCLDGLRVGFQWLHSAALHLSDNPYSGQVRSLFGVMLPAGISSPLSGQLFLMNCLTLTLTASAVAAGSGVGPLASVAAGLLLPRVLLAARFARLVFECAYLAASLTRQTTEHCAIARALASDDAEALDTVYETNHIPAHALMHANDPPAPGSSAWFSNLLHAIYSAPSAAVSAAASATQHAADTATAAIARASNGAIAPPAPAAAAAAAAAATKTIAKRTEAAPEVEAIALRLDAFSSAVMAGLRGYLRGEEALQALTRIFKEVDLNADGKIDVDEVAAWVLKEPVDGGGVKWRASVRRVLSSVAARVLQSPTKPQPQDHTLLAALTGSAVARLGEKQRPPSGTAVVTDGVPRGAPAAAAAAPPLANKRGLRLLSLEGGGVKGLTLVWQLMELERRTGRKCYEMFDLIGGTSTGGIIALAIANRVPLADVEQLYYRTAGEVFAKTSAFRQLMVGYQAESAPLLTILKDYLGDSPMRRPPNYDGPKAFVVTTKVDGGDQKRLELRILRTYDTPAPSGGRDGKEGWAQWEAAAATSAAPTILPAFRREDGSTFIDGALSGYNNPSLLVLTEGLDLAAGRPVELMVSLGCGDPTGVAEGRASLVYWVGQIINLAFDVQLQEERTLRLLHTFSPDTRYIRLAPPTAAYGLAEHRPEELARMKAECLLYLNERSPELDTLSKWIVGAEEPRKRLQEQWTNAVREESESVFANSNSSADAESGGDLKSEAEALLHAVPPMR